MQPSIAPLTSVTDPVIRPVQVHVGNSEQQDNTQHHAPKAQYRVSVVIPAKNEAKNLPYVLPKIPKWVHEVVLIDGNSTDGTINIARQLRPDIRIIQQPRPGKGAALCAGFAAATGDIIVMLDADGSMDPSEIGTFVRVLRDGADFAKGSRFMQGAGTSDMTRFRYFGNTCLTMLVRLLFGGRFTDLCYGYNAFWADLLPVLDLQCDGFEIETLMNVRALTTGMNIFEIHSFEADRVHGQSNLRTIPDGWRVFKTIMRERLKPRRTASPSMRAATRVDTFTYLGEHRVGEQQ